MTSDWRASGGRGAVLDDASPRVVADARWRRRGIAALVVLAHAFGVYVACQPSRVTLALEGGAPAGPSVHVRLVAAPAPRPAESPPAPPVPGPPVAKAAPPRPVTKAHPVLSSTAPSQRTVQATRDADASPPTPKLESARPPPAPLQAAHQAPQQAAQQAALPSQAAQASASSQHAASPDLLSAPQPISAGELQQLGCQMPRPDYPAKAKRLEQEGTVMVNLVIGTDGAVTAARVAHSSGSPLLDAAALAAIRAGRCRPFETAGIARVVEATQPVAFSLNN
jgi:protein TonB